MVLDRGFIKKAIPILEKDSLIAGIGGKINEMTNSNIIFQKRKSFHESEFKEDEYVDKLMMGGIYKRSAIEKVEYFSNQCLHSYEESDLGYRLKLAGFKLKRVPLQMITHYGDNKSSMQIIKDRWKSKYLWGCGEFLRQNILKKTFINAAFEVRLYLTVIFLWLLILICLAISPITPLPLSILILFLLSSSLLLIIRKKNIIEYLFSIFSWNITAIGLICGFINGQGDPKKRIEIKKIK
jgi:GT2 family glycosyltransferase